MAWHSCRRCRWVAALACRAGFAEPAHGRLGERSDPARRRGPSAVGAGQFDHGDTRLVDQSFLGSEGMAAWGLVLFPWSKSVQVGNQDEGDVSLGRSSG